MSQGKTIKQIADELGVSKQAVHQKRKKLSIDLQPFTTMVDGTVYISVDGEKLIKQAFNGGGHKHVDDNVDDNEPTTNRQSVDGLLSVISDLSEQIKAQQRTIDTLGEALKQEQALHAASKGMLLVPGDKATATKRLRFLFRGRLD